jgi:hypothetical protein
MEKSRRPKGVGASEDHCEEQLKFEALLTEISTHFINLPPDQVDSEIEDAQRRV